MEIMDINLYAYVMRKFSERTLSYNEIAEGSGVPKRTAEKIARGEIADPSVSSVEKLARFFRQQEGAQ